MFGFEEIYQDKSKLTGHNNVKMASYSIKMSFLTRYVSLEQQITYPFLTIGPSTLNKFYDHDMPAFDGAY